MCCKHAPCPYGELDPETGWCEHLTESAEIGDATIYRCARCNYIKTRPGWEVCPAFGGGCGSTLFNEDRNRILAITAKLLKRAE